MYTSLNSRLNAPWLGVGVKKKKEQYIVDVFLLHQNLIDLKKN
jgi:hypothetical protein